jgi:TetR/AcrR family transcriptional regulator, acrAB operon repressor
MRRTKAESEATRRSILAAARRVFARRGVTRSTLEHVAAEAGVTRGAIYWHFANKAALFDAMREQVSVPLIDRTDCTLLATRVPDPLSAAERFLCGVLDSIANDSDTRETFRIMMLKCEYVDEFESEPARQTGHWRELERKLGKVYARAQRAGMLRAGLTPAMAALDTCVFLSGLMRLWLLDEAGTLIRKRAQRLTAAHIAGYRRGVARREAAGRDRPVGATPPAARRSPEHRHRRSRGA